MRDVYPSRSEGSGAYWREMHQILRRFAAQDKVKK
jgi:hypothetical protein